MRRIGAGDVVAVAVIVVNLFLLWENDLSIRLLAAASIVFMVMVLIYGTKSSPQELRALGNSDPRRLLWAAFQLLLGAGFLLRGFNDPVRWSKILSLLLASVFLSWGLATLSPFPRTRPPVT